MSAIYPPRRGNQVRSAELLNNLGDGWHVDSYSLTFQRTDLPLPRRDHVVSPSWTDHRIRNPLLIPWVRGLGRAGYPPVFAGRFAALWPHGKLTAAIGRADVVMVHPPHHWEWVRSLTPATVPMVLDEQGIEADMYPARGTRWTRHVAMEVRRAEAVALRSADMVIVTADDDAEKARRAGARDVLLVPNGVDLDQVLVVSPSDRRELRRRLGLPPARAIGVFVGSGHPPNVAAVEALESRAAAFAAAGLLLVVVGRSGIGRRPVPNVVHTGEVDAVAPYLGAADIVLCPLSSGSGTSIKAIESLASGAPLVSTAIGVRGLGLRPGVEVEICDLDEMPGAVTALLADPGRMSEMAQAARKVAETRFSWRAAGARAADALDRLVPRRATQG